MAVKFRWMKVVTASLALAVRLAGQAPVTDYVLGAGDQVSLQVADLEEFAEKTFRVDMKGDITLPYAGHFRAAGMTTAQLEAEVRERLSLVLKNPEVIVTIAAYGSQPVSVLGSVNSPGIHQIEGHKNLFEVLSLAGGLRADAGYVIHISRDLKWGPLPLPDAKTEGTQSIGTVKVKDVMTGSASAANITILPGDQVSVSKADVVYAIGCINKPGGFLLDGHESLSALQVISLAGGMVRTAAGDRAKILRPVAGSEKRVEIPINLKKLMAGKGEDLALKAGDILFVPNSDAKSVEFRTLDAIAAASAAALILAKQ